ncbi:hypothetical protein Tco_0873411 [Tanacetum coccineum]
MLWDLRQEPERGSEYRGSYELKTITVSCELQFFIGKSISGSSSYYDTHAYHIGAVSSYSKQDIYLCKYCLFYLGVSVRGVALLEWEVGSGGEYGSVKIGGEHGSDRRDKWYGLYSSIQLSTREASVCADAHYYCGDVLSVQCWRRTLSRSALMVYMFGKYDIQVRLCPTYEHTKGGRSTGTNSLNIRAECLRECGGDDRQHYCHGEFSSSFVESPAIDISARSFTA